MIAALVGACGGDGFSSDDGSGGAGGTAGASGAGGGSGGGSGGASGSGGAASGGAGGGSGGTAGAGGGSGGTAGGGSGGAAGGSCEQHTFAAKADTSIYPYNGFSGNCSSWSWSINGGPGSIVPIGAINQGASRALVRFELGSDVVAKLANPGSTMELVLTRVPGGSDCGATCPFATGKIQAYPLVVGWAEGDGGNDTGANWCFAGAGSTKPWSSPGASGGQDSGALAGYVDVQDGASTVTLPLSFDPFLPWVDVSKGQLSVLLTPANGVQLFVAAREHATLAEPTLVVKACE